MTVRNNHISLGMPSFSPASMRLVWNDQLSRDVAYVPPSDDDNGNANACLIAAAPELLHAAKDLCRKLIEYADDGLDVPGEWLALERAVNKAEGR